MDGLTFAIIVVFEFPPRESCIHEPFKKSFDHTQIEKSTCVSEILLCNLPEVEMSTSNLGMEHVYAFHVLNPPKTL